MKPLLILLLSTSVVSAACRTPGTVLSPLIDERNLATHKILNPEHLERLWNQLPNEDPAWLRRFDIGLFVTLSDGSGQLHLGYDNLLCWNKPIEKDIMPVIRNWILPPAPPRVPRIHLPRKRQYKIRPRVAEKPPVVIERPLARNLEQN